MPSGRRSIRRNRWCACRAASRRGADRRNDTPIAAIASPSRRSEPDEASPTARPNSTCRREITRRVGLERDRSPRRPSSGSRPEESTRIEGDHHRDRNSPRRSPPLAEETLDRFEMIQPEAKNRSPVSNSAATALDLGMAVVMEIVRRARQRCAPRTRSSPSRRRRAGRGSPPTGGRASRSSPRRPPWRRSCRCWPDRTPARPLPSVRHEAFTCSSWTWLQPGDCFRLIPRPARAVRANDAPHGVLCALWRKDGRQ